MKTVDLPHHGSPGRGAPGAGAFMLRAWRSITSALLQVAVVVGLMVLVIAGVGFDAFSKLAAEYARVLVAGLGPGARTAISLTAWVSVLIGVFWVLDIAPILRPRLGAAWGAVRTSRQWLLFAAGWVMIGVGAVALLALES